MADIVEDNLNFEEDTQKGKFLIFSLGKENYGIEIKFVTEIIGIQSITEIPGLPPYVKGVINLRGKIIPIMDVRLRFGKASREYDDRTCIIVVDIQEMSIGLVVDRVAEVTSISDQDIAPPPQLSKDFQKYIRGIGKVSNEIKLILDCTLLMGDEDLISATQI